MARERVPDDLDDDEELLDEEEEEGLAREAGWADALQEQFGSVPWWVISTAVHIVVLVLLSLLVVSEDRMDTTDTIIPMDVAEQPPPLEEELNRDDISDRNVDIHEDDVEHPVILHEDVEELDHMETENNMDDNTARGEEEAISDIPTGGTGVVGNLGVGGGAAGAYGFRGGGGRRRAALRGGGSKKSENAVDRALEWLWRHQAADGHWDGESTFKGKKYEPDDPGENTDPGVTGLAILAFLGAGNTEKSGKEKFQKTVRKGVAWLIRKQKANGSIGEGYDGKLGYNHPIAGLALAEAFGMAQVAATGRAAQKAVDYSTKVHQVEYGGWRYKAQMAADTSVTGWFVMQLKSSLIAGLKVSGRGFQGAARFLETVTKEGGKIAYKPSERGTPTMTAVGMLCRQFMGMKRDDPILTGGANYLARFPPEWDENTSTANFYNWYYGTLVMFQMGGEWWNVWNATLSDLLTERQRRGPPAVDGSWDPDGFWCSSGGRVYSTALGCLCLEVYYRYLPIYGGKK